MVQVSTDSAIDELSKLGRVVFGSSLVDWVGLETEEANRSKIVNMPGVLRVERERTEAFC